VQVIIPSLEQDDAELAEDSLHLPRSSLTPFQDSSVCWGELKPDQCAVCVIPLASTLISAVVIGCYLFHTWKITVRMGKIAINQSIEQRMRLFRSSVTVLLLFSLVFRGLSVIWNPGHVLHEFCKMADFVAMLFFVMALSFILVIRPVREARIADKNVKSVTITLW